MNGRKARQSRNSAPLRFVERAARAQRRQHQGVHMAVKRSEVFEWISTLVRLAMAGILIFAAIPKLQDIQQSIRAVRAYQLLPEAP